jgi:hypothetical protein
VLQHKGADLFDDSDHNALFATVEVTAFSRNAAKFPAWGSSQIAEQPQNITSNEEIARVAQEEQNKKRGLRGFLMANNNVTRRRRRLSRKTHTRKN